MQSKKFYPEVIVRLLEDPTSSSVAIVYDDGKLGELNLQDRSGKNPSDEEIVKYFDEKAELYIKDNSIRKMKEEIQGNQELMQEISAEIMAEDPTIMTRPMDMLAKVNDIVDSKAKEMIKTNSMIREGSVIRIGGITRDDNGKLILDSKTIIYDGDKPSMSGIYMYAVNSNKVPVVIKKKNGFNRVQLDTILMSKDQLDRYFSHALDTVNAYIKGEITKLPKPFIMFKDMKDRQSTPDNIKIAIDTINSREADAKDIYDALKKFKEYIDNSDINIIEKFDINIPIVDNNIDFEAVKVATLTKMLNTSLAQLSRNSDPDEVRKAAEKVFNDMLESESIVLHSSYNPPKSNVGFFPQSLNQQFIISSTNYDDILNEVNDIINNKKNIEQENSEIER